MLVKRINRAISRAELLKASKERDLSQMKVLEGFLTKTQKRRINVLADIIEDMTKNEQATLWKTLNEKMQNSFGKDPKLFNDFRPTGDKWANLPPQVSDMFQQIGVQGCFPNGLIELFVQGKMGGLSAGGAPQKEKVEEKQEVVVEKTNFDVLIKGFSADGKLKIIKEVKNLLAIGLKDAKDRVEASVTTPLMIGKQLPKEQAEQLEKQYKELGAEIELK
ncbi:unnamed protein product [Blepharisma stoltei]|uniref:Large ribosomal subunit protein bL12 C-terminal domain-containing protein n=1 Tax=Blepharisma stoltei TaxID=1481888 RepID=A0AAU9IDT3_9CILI|nr:unnamed protein product [Blepharisma stoltei]